MPLLFGLVGMLIGVVLGAAGVGEGLTGLLPDDGKQARDMAEMSHRVDDLKRDLHIREKELAAEREARVAAVAALKQATEATERARLTTTLKEDFLDRLVAHEQARTEASKAALVDTLCSLWKQRQTARLSLATAALELTEEQIRSGLRAEIEQVLQQGGVGPDLLARARRHPSQIPMPPVTPYNVFEVQRAAQARQHAMRDAREAVAAIQRQAGAIRVAKTVRFAEGPEYTLAPEVALLMLARPDCKTG